MTCSMPKHPLFAFLLLGLHLFSCKAQEVSLKSTGWTLVRLDGESMPATLREPVTLIFNEDQTRVSGFGGCNRYFGNCQLTGNRITFSQLGSTKMFCAENMTVEDKFFRLLSEVDVYKVADQKLQLTAGGRLLFEFIKTKELLH